MKLTDLIERAPWREAITFRHTWPHEYVLLQKDHQRELLEAVCERFRNGEGVPSRFFAMNNVYLHRQPGAVHRRLQVLVDGASGRSGLGR